MSFPSLFAILFARGALRRRRALLHWLPSLVLVLAGMLGSSIAQATVYTFGSAAVYPCTLAGKVHTCPSSAYLDDDDQVIIATGYTVKVTSNVTVGFNQGLTMGPGARLIVTGFLNIAGVRASNLKVSGGDIDVGATFSMGSLTQSITANVTAEAIQLGSSGVTINGALTSRGLVSISSNSKINGDIKGSVVTTSTPVTITGDVTATTKFTLASGSTVNGDITTPVFDMLAANSTVTGGVTASSKVTMGSGSTIGGNVDTGDLVLQASSATIGGNASVNWATLENAGKVTGTIYCKNGTAKNKCDCVTNNSGFKLNSKDGPRCEGLAPKGPHHFQITHDGVGDTCVPEKITVLACANASCTAPHYTDGVSGQLTPFGAAFSIPANASTAVVSATRIPTGQVTLDIGSSSPTVLWATTCTNSFKNNNSCAMEFLGGAKLMLTAPNHLAGDSATLKVRAVKQNDAQTACVTAFANVSYNVAYRCSYSKPSTGTKPLTLNGTALACTASGSLPSIKTDFDANGEDTLTLSYPDAGELDLSATADSGKGMSASGSTSFIVAPKTFELVKPAAPLRAGASFDLVLRAKNAAGAITENFDTTKLDNAGATGHTVALDVDCRFQAGENGLLAYPAFSFAKGVASAKLAWSEVGRIDVKASVVKFLGSELNPGGSTDLAASGCSGNVGPFIPAYFMVSLPDGRPSYYSGEPFALQVSAMSAGGTVTKNYNGALGLSEALTLAANDKDGKAFTPAAPGTLSIATIAAAAFQDGIASVKPAYTLASYPASPAQVRLRASNGKANGDEVASTLPDAAEQARPHIRSGRLRLGSRVGSLKAPLSIPVTAEYWSGRSWLLNIEDDYTVISPAAFAFSLGASDMTLAKTFTPGPFKLAKGAAAFTLQLSAGGPGWVDFAANLGAGNTDNSCLATHPSTSGAALPWLRPLNAACGAQARKDPSGRASFGLLPPEQRRLIHVREVFN